MLCLYKIQDLGTKKIKKVYCKDVLHVNSKQHVIATRETEKIPTKNLVINVMWGVYNLLPTNKMQGTSVVMRKRRHFYHVKYWRHP